MQLKKKAKDESSSSEEEPEKPYGKPGTSKEITIDGQILEVTNEASTAVVANKQVSHKFT